MNSASRLSNILKKLQKSPKNIAYDILSDIFETKSCVSLANKLMLCTSQVEILKKGNAHIGLTGYLESVFDCKMLQKDITTLKSQASSYIMALDTVANYMPSDKKDIDAVKELSVMLLSMEKEIDTASIGIEHKEVLKSFISEISEGIEDMEIGGVDSLFHHAEIASGKIVLYNEAFTETGFYSKTIKIYEKVTKILSDSQVWAGTLGVVMSKLIG